MKLRSKLTDHLDLTVHMCLLDHWWLDNLPFDNAFVAWKQVKDKYVSACMRQFSLPTCYDRAWQVFNRLGVL